MYIANLVIEISMIVDLPYVTILSIYVAFLALALNVFFSYTHIRIHKSTYCNSREKPNIRCGIDTINKHRNIDYY